MERESVGKLRRQRSAARRCPNGSITVNSQRTHIGSEVHACAPSTLMYVNACDRPRPPADVHNIATINGIWLTRQTFSTKVDICKRLAAFVYT